MVRESDWFGCYSGGWKNEIQPEAFSHPAKFARGLIRRIYEYAIERGYLKEGDTVLDPFAGVALGSLDAMFHGLHFVGCELEQKFVDLGNQNIDLWNRRYGNGKLRRWGTAVILQGDSRNLVEVLREIRVQGFVTSPPYSALQTKTGKVDESSWSDGKPRPIGASQKESNGYGTDPANLGNMPTGEPPSAVISSPPLGKAQSGGTSFWEGLEEKHNRKFSDRVREGSHGYREDQLGDSEGQLGMMREGNVDAVISSPPYAEGCAHTGGVDPKPEHVEGGELHFVDYGRTEGQLAAMREGDVDAVIGSPPYAKAQAHPSIGSVNKDDWGADGRDIVARRGLDAKYGSQDGQLAALPEGEPPLADLSADRQDRPAGIVSSPPYWDSLERHGEKPEDVRARMREKGWSEESVRKVTAHSNDTQSGYGIAEGQLAAETQPDTFWSASRQIMAQCYEVLAPGGVAIFVTKRFVRDKKIVKFSQQWADLCQSCGFELIEWVRAWLVEERGTQYDLLGKPIANKIERKSFFRRLYEYKARAAKFWLSVPRSKQASYLWQAHSQLWTEYREGLDDPEIASIRPTRSRIISAAQVTAYKGGGEPDIETDTQIDWEDVLIFKKPATSGKD